MVSSKMKFVSAFMFFGDKAYEMEKDAFPETYDFDGIISAVKQHNPAADTGAVHVTRRRAIPEIGMKEHIIVSAIDNSWQVMYQ